MTLWMGIRCRAGQRLDAVFGQTFASFTVADTQWPAGTTVEQAVVCKALAQDVNHGLMVGRGAE